MTARRPRPFRRVLTAGLAALLGLSSWAGIAPAGAADATSQAPTDIDNVVIDSPGYRRAVAELGLATSAIASANSDRVRIKHLISELESGTRVLERSFPALEDQVDASVAVVGRAREDLVDLAVLQYVMRGTDAELETLTSHPADLSEPLGKRLTINTIAAGHLRTLRNAERRHGDALSAVASSRLGRADLNARLDQARANLEAARLLIAENSERQPHLEARIADERRRTHVVGSDLSYVALDAYLLGARQANRDHPGCMLDWTLLAGIGRVESRHGTYRGGSLDSEGNVERPIIGIRLNGSRGTAVVLDSDAGTIDGDPDFDRAVGPMQFIPSTWRAFASDGNNDGTADPHNIYDAAVSAGQYLCSRGALDSEEATQVAVLRYNNSDVYVRAVMVNADQYRDLHIST